ncbi:hypothetical protein F5Y04DRAFT_279129 [Hypomontagnella monticulosa]|nr:hypothetical protein F5Y04DRAFT_279129 [Hypomontagnella monticulosa]
MASEGLSIKPDVPLIVGLGIGTILVAVLAILVYRSRYSRENDHAESSSEVELEDLRGQTTAPTDQASTSAGIGNRAITIRDLPEHAIDSEQSETDRSGQNTFIPAPRRRMAISFRSVSAFLESFKKRPATATAAA